MTWATVCTGSDLFTFSSILFQKPWSHNKAGDVSPKCQSQSFMNLILKYCIETFKMFACIICCQYTENLYPKLLGVY